MSHVLLTHAPGAEARAALVAAKLGALGFEVRQEIGPHSLSPLERRKLARDIDQAACVVVLWSREAAEAPALFATAQRARAAGKLAFARLDVQPTPMGFGADAANLSQWMGRAEARSWRSLVASVTAKAASVAKPRKAAKPAKPVKAAKLTTAKPVRQHGAAMLTVGFLVVFGVLFAAAALFTP